MDPKPVLHALVARIQADGWVRPVSLLPLDEAEAFFHEYEDACILIDPEDQQALGKWEREQLPHNKPRMWFGTSGE